MLSVPRKEVGNYVPAPAVIRRPQALSGFIGRKAHVGSGFASLLLKPRPNDGPRGRYGRTRGVRGAWNVHGVGVKSVDIVHGTPKAKAVHWDLPDGLNHESVGSKKD
jgi:hypothetical protein